MNYTLIIRMEKGSENILLCQVSWAYLLEKQALIMTEIHSEQQSNLK